MIQHDGLRWTPALWETWRQILDGSRRAGVEGCLRRDRIQQVDGSITGSVYRVGSLPCRGRVARWRIGADGRIIYGPAWFDAAAPGKRAAVFPMKGRW